MNVLVVDDVVVSREVLRAVARKAFDASTVEAASDLRSGLSTARAMASVDVVLLDLELPDCEGLNGLAQFRERFPEAKIVVVSALASDEIVTRSLDAGADAFIPKTATGPAIVAALRRCIAGRDGLRDEFP